MSNKKKFDADLLNTVIGENSEVKGTIHSQGSILVEGTHEGEINAKGEVLIGQNSFIQGNVFAKRVVISGEVHGNVEAINGVKIAETGKVYGDITGDRLIVEEGGIYKGKVNMDIISSKNLYEGKFELVRSGA